MANGDTKVQFSLWAVLGVLVVAAVILFSDLYGGQRSAQKATVDVCNRVTILEENYKHIISAQEKTTVAIEKAADAIRDSEKALLAHEKSQAQMKRWQDIPGSR
jgi:hypothetical protein